MRTIAQIVKDIKGELHGAKHYAELANKYKDEDDSLSEMYASTSNQELGHVNTMHAQVVRIINDYRRKHGEPPGSDESYLGLGTPADGGRGCRGQAAFGNRERMKNTHPGSLPGGCFMRLK